VDADDGEDKDEDNGAAVEQRLVACKNGSLLSWNRRIFGLVATGISVLVVVVPIGGVWTCAAAVTLRSVSLGGAMYDGSEGSGRDVAADDADG
jgi:hypothetical protein